MQPPFYGVHISLPIKAKSNTFGWWGVSASQRRVAFVYETCIIPRIIYSSILNPHSVITVLILILLSGTLKKLVGQADTEMNRARTDLYHSAH